MTLVKEISIRESILLCIENKIIGAGSQLASFDKSGRLASKDQINALRKNLECLYNEVLINGSGKRGTVKLTGLKDSPDAKIDGRINNSRKPTDDDLFMDEYVFNRLVQLGGGIHPLSKWIIEIELYDLRQIRKSSLIHVIEKLHSGGIALFRPENVVNKFVDSLNDRNRDIVEKAFRRLSRANRIKTTELYIFRKLNGECECVEKYLYDKVENEVKEIVLEFGLSYRDYIWRKMNAQYRDEEIFNCQKKVDKYLKDTHEIQYFYKNISVEILDESIHLDVNKMGMLEAYFRRLITLTENKQNRESYQNTRFIEKEFYMLNTFVLLDKLGIGVPESVIENEKETLMKRHEEIYDLNFIYHWDKAELERQEFIKNSGF